MDPLNSVERAEPMLLRVSEGDSARRPAPGKWSPREPAMLDFMQDYAGHLQHHMRQILGVEWSA